MDKNVLRNIKGTNDFLPKEQIIRNKIINTLTSVFNSYGYLPLETTTLCYYDLLASKYAGGAEILKEVYKLKDQGDRKLGLRYDLTVPFAKVISMNMNKGITLPFRRYEIGKVFRDGPVKLGRDREFYQCDVDCCGIEGSLVEAEFMAMAKKAYNKLGIDIEIEWNNRKLLSGLIRECDIDEEDVSRVILSVDKLAKIGEDGVLLELKDIDSNKIKKLFGYFKMDILGLEDSFKDSNNELLEEGIKEVKELSSYLDKLDLKECVFRPYLARGLEIYTGTVWEVFDKKKRITSSIGAGGRYDKIITNFINDGNSYPAVGMTFGLVPIYEIIKMDMTDDSKSFYDLMIIPMDTDIECLKLADNLREYGIKVIIEMNKRKMKKSLDYANKNNIPYVIIIGENELNDGKIKIKKMNESREEEVNIDDIDKMLDIMKFAK